MWSALFWLLAGGLPLDVAGHYVAAKGDFDVHLVEPGEILFSASVVKEMGQTVHFCELNDKFAPLKDNKASYRFFPTQEYFTVCHLEMQFYPAGVEVRQVTGSCDCGQGVSLTGWYRKVRRSPGD